MSTFANIKSGIKIILEADADLDSKSVFDYEPAIDEISNDPIAVVVASDNASEFATTGENRREYAFLVRLYVERASRGENEAEGVLTGLVDRLINAFDQDITLSVSGVLFAFASPSSWGYILGSKEYRVADIRLRVVVYFDVS